MLSHSSSLRDVVTWLIGIIDTIIPVLTVLALVLFLYSGFRYMMKAEESKGKGPEREALLWGIISLFIIVSVWGLLRIMCMTLIGNTMCR